MWRYTHNLQALYETPALTGGPAERGESSPGGKNHPDGPQSQSHLVNRIGIEAGSRDLWHTYCRVPYCNKWRGGRKNATEIGRPVVLRLYSEVITHKTDLRGVKLSLRTGKEVRQAYRSIKESVQHWAGAFLGVTVEPMIEPRWLRAYPRQQHRSAVWAGPSLRCRRAARRSCKGLCSRLASLKRHFSATYDGANARLYGSQGRPGPTPVNLPDLENLLVRFSLLVAEQRWIKEIDVNPLLASRTQILALNARIVLHSPELSEQGLPRLAIRPYPQQYVRQWKLRDGTPLTIRPIRPEDEPLMVQFHGTLSEESVHFRYFGIVELSSALRMNA